MKTFRILLASILIVALASVAMAAYTGVLPTDNTPFTVQNVTGVKPVPAASTCSTITAKTKGTIGTFSTVDSSGKSYLMLDWTATDATGSFVVVKRFLNSNAAFKPGSSGQVVLGRGSDVTSVHFDLYSTATPKTYTICTDWQ